VVASLVQDSSGNTSDRNSRGSMASRLDGRFQYIRNGDGTEELFDYKQDPTW
jgi:hypothetical protein